MKTKILLLFALLTVGVASAQNAIISRFNEAATAIHKQDFNAAITLLENVLTRGAKSNDEKVAKCIALAKKYLPACYQAVGIAAIEQKNYTKAAEQLIEAMCKAEISGDSNAVAKANNLLTKVYRIQGGEAINAKDYATAATLLEKGYAINPNNVAIALDLAVCYCELGKQTEGFALFDKICAMPADKYAEFITKAKEKKKAYLAAQKEAKPEEKPTEQK